MIEPNLKERVVRYVDGELSPMEGQALEQALASSQELKAYYEEVVRLKSVMDQWPALDSSADWERKLNKHLADAGIVEDKEMKKFNFKSVAVLIVCVLALSLTLNVYIKRGLQGRLRSAADDIGDQYSVGNTDGTKTVKVRNSLASAQYEPYYQSSNYSVDKDRSPGQASTSTGSAVVPDLVNRKIIQTVTLNLQVASSRAAQMHINLLVSRYSGIIANSTLTTSPDGSSATITFKILPTHLSEVLSEIHALGKVESENMTGQDVTAQFVDLDSRLKNLKVERQRLIKLMEEKPGKITDVLEVERELTRVTGDLEAMEGQLRVLSSLSDLATVTVNVHEPAITKLKPGFWSTLYVKDRFVNALHSCVDVSLSTVNGIIIAAGFLFPAGIFLLVVWGIAVLIQKILKKK